jgi:hypothetical protein
VRRPPKSTPRDGKRPRAKGKAPAPSEPPYSQRIGAGKLQEAVAASRKARRLLDGHGAREQRETFFWEGLALHLTGHRVKAEEALREFLAVAAVGRRQVVLAKEARVALDTIRS